MISILTRNLLCLSAVIAISACGGGDSGSKPKADFSIKCVDFVCVYDASISTSDVKPIVRYSWQFGDGAAGSGKIVHHPYEESGEVTVTLRVIAEDGATSVATRTVNVTGSPIASSYSLVHDVISIHILIDETMHGLFDFVDSLQAAVEANGPPGGTAYDIDCDTSGSASVIAWEDSNANMLVDGAESLKFSADSCKFPTAANAVSTSDTATAIGDFGSTSFSLQESTKTTAGMGLDRYSGWGISGNLAFTVDHGSSPEKLSYSGTETALAFSDENGNVLARLAFDASMSSLAPALNNITGDITYTISQVDYVQTVLEPVTFSRNPDRSVSMDAGRFSIKGGSRTIEVRLDADPAYLRISIDEASDGDIDLTGRVAQSVAVDALDD